MGICGGRGKSFLGVRLFNSLENIIFVYTISIMAKAKPNLSMRIDPQIKEAFRDEVYQQGVGMTETIENFMVKYREAGIKSRANGKG